MPYFGLGQFSKVRFLGFLSCSFSTVDLNTRAKLRVRGRPLEWNFKIGVSGILIFFRPWGS